MSGRFERIWKKNVFLYLPGVFTSPMARKCEGQLGLGKIGLGLRVWGDGLFEVV